MNAKQADTQASVLTIQRTFEAPRDLVYRLWTDPEHLKRWCCPKGFSIPVSEGKVREGGWFKTCMRSPDGQDHWLGGKYLELTAPSKIVFTHAWLDESGEPEHETLVTVTLENDAGRTRLTLHQAHFVSDASRDGHRGGWEETLDNLAAHLARREPNPAA